MAPASEVAPWASRAGHRRASLPEAISRAGRRHCQALGLSAGSLGTLPSVQSDPLEGNLDPVTHASFIHPATPWPRPSLALNLEQMH